MGILSQIGLREGYDMITGVSAGGLNAGFLSYYNAGTEGLSFMDGIENLASIYSNLKNEDVYERNSVQVYKTWSPKKINLVYFLELLKIV